MALRVGQRVEERARSTAQAGRAGVIREVVRGDPTPRYRIRWNDGHETVYTPAAGCLRVLAPPSTRASGQATAGKRASGQATAGKRASGSAPGQPAPGQTATPRSRPGRASARKPR
jgi:hypothetical protein